MSDAAYRFAQPEPDIGADSSILDMADPAARAKAATIMERLAYPTLRHARIAVKAAENWIEEAQYEFRRCATMTMSTHPIDRLIQTEAWRAGVVRQACRTLRMRRAGWRAARARVRRYLGEDLAHAFERERITRAQDIRNKREEGPF